MADTIANIVVFGAVTLTLTVWAWRWRYKESGALVAFCLGPFWGFAIAGIYIFVFQGANLDNGWAHISFVYHGVICGISLAIFFSILQFVTLQFAVRQDYETRPDSEFCQKDKVSDTSMAIHRIEIRPDDDLRKTDDVCETSTAAKPIEIRPLSHKSKAVLTVIAVAMLLGIAWWMTAPKTHDMRHGEPSDWTEEFASDFPGSEIESAGITNLGRFYLINSEQLIIASLATPSQLVTLALPNALKIPFNSYWRVSEDETGQRIICSNQYNNMAVWNLAEPQRPQYVWSHLSESMALPFDSQDNDGRFATFDNTFMEGVQNGSQDIKDRRRFNVAYLESPDGKLVCIHTVDLRDGVVRIRSLETGLDVAELPHEGSGRKVSLVAWSGDSQRLATFATDGNVNRVWRVSDQSLLCRTPLPSTQNSSKWLALNSDGSKLFSCSEPYETVLTMIRVSSGEIDRSVQLDWESSVLLSPDNQHLAVVTAHQLLLLNTETLEKVHESKIPGRLEALAFRRDGAELAATWMIPNEMMGSQAGVKAWDVNSKSIVLDASIGPWGTAKWLGYCPDGRLLAGNLLFAPLQGK